MTNIPESWSVDQLRDLASIEYYQRAQKEHPDDQDLLKRIWKGIVATSRDNARTPMQWNDEKNAGFSEETAWMTVNDNYKKINVEKQSGNAGSVLEFWKTMLHVRKTEANLFIHGSFRAHDLNNEKTFTFEKTTSGGEAALLVLNFSEDECEINMPETNSEGKTWQLRLSNVDKDGDKLRPWEGRLYFGA